ncbi:DNRLRE domain-containing protein [Brevibacillus laterosporus]|uniref:DNRLRE domain-containing protein n=1 Tax=Brevibacillus laterosporus TaxID=1465 RepID=UPI0013CED124
MPPLIRFSNCVFDDQSLGASFQIIIFNPSQNTVINCFKQKSSWSTERFRGLVEFDLSKLPKKKELKRAKLKLYCGYLDSPINLSLFEILDDWREHDVTWSNQLFNYKPKNHQLPLY